MAALSDSEVALIRASWEPARKDPIGAGALLFKGLFTKFPDYLKFFSQFSDLDLEALQTNARLIKHAVKVIETVTFVVDSIGEPAKGALLNEALANLVRGHLKRRIGLREFRNLGIVLLDFLCDLNNRRPAGCSGKLVSGSQLAGSGGGGTNSSASSSQDSETMTSALDKIRASASPSSSSEGDNALGLLGASCSGALDELPVDHQENHNHRNERRFAHEDDSTASGANDPDDPDDMDEEEEAAAAERRRRRQMIKLDAGRLVAAWTKLYGTILDLVEVEETSQKSQAPLDS